MTLTQNKEREKYVACDDPTCGQKYYTQFRSDSPALRTELRHEGWVTGNDGKTHFCPVHRPKTQLEHNLASQLNEDVPEIKAALDSAFKTIAASENRDMVNHPAHYGGADNPYEVIKVIDDWKLGFALGNTVKYIARAEHKGSELEDLKKARWYLEHRIKQLETLNGGLVSLRGGPVYTKVELHLATNELGLGGSRKVSCGQWANSWTESPGDVTCKSCLQNIQVGRPAPPAQKLTGGGYMCPFCKSSEYKTRLNADEVACVCGATAKWPAKGAERERWRTNDAERELCELGLTLMKMTETTTLEAALRDLELATSFTLRHEELNPTHLLYEHEGVVACGRPSAELTSVTTARKFAEVTCKDCRVAFLKARPKCPTCKKPLMWAPDGEYCPNTNCKEFRDDGATT